MVGAGLVLVAVLAIVGFSMAQQGSPSARGGHGDGMEPAPPSVVDAVSRVPQTAFAAAGVAATRSGPYVKSVSKLKVGRGPRSTASPSSTTRARTGALTALRPGGRSQSPLPIRKLHRTEADGIGSRPG